MILKCCSGCEYHGVVEIERGIMESRCGRENCFSRYSKCVLNKALEKFLKEGEIIYDEGTIRRTQRM